MGKPMTKKQLLTWVIVQTYLAGHSPQAIAAALNKKPRSIIMKLWREGVYTLEQPKRPGLPIPNWGF